MRIDQLLHALLSPEVRRLRDALSAYTDLLHNNLEPESAAVLAKAVELSLAAQAITLAPNLKSLLSEFGLADLLDVSTIVSAPEQIQRFANAEKLGPEFVYLPDKRRRLEHLLDFAEVSKQLVLPAEGESNLAMLVESQDGIPLLDTEMILREIGIVYNSFQPLVESDNAEPLRLIATSSGTSFKFQFIGAAQVVAEIRKLFREVWTRIRTRNTDSMREALAVLKQASELQSSINVKVADGRLSKTQAREFEYAIARSCANLFDNGALTSDIPETEVVSSGRLLQQTAPKRLEAMTATGAEEDATDPVAGTKDGEPSRKRKRPKHKAKKRRKTGGGD